MANDWKTLDTKKVVKKQQEQTMSVNAGGFATPLGGKGPLKPAFAVNQRGLPQKKKTK